jgi:hypothetical protein
MLSDLLSVLGFLAGAGLLLAEAVLLFLIGYLLFLTGAAIVVWITRPGERLGANGGPLKATAEAGRQPAPGRWGTPHTRFAILVPAHNEERLIRTVVGSLLAVDYPADLYRV